MSNEPAGGFAGNPAEVFNLQPTSGCCGTAPVPGPATDAGSTCCGTAEAATVAGSCCDPGAKAVAVADGASCCG